MKQFSLGSWTRPALGVRRRPSYLASRRCRPSWEAPQGCRQEFYLEEVIKKLEMNE